MKRLTAVGLIVVLSLQAAGCAGKGASNNVISTSTGVSDIIAAQTTQSDFFGGDDEDSYETENDRYTIAPPEEGIDVDLTSMSATMVYSMVYSMMTTPDEFVGKSVKMRGEYIYFNDDTTGHVYHGCIIYDATACCAQGMEFVPYDKYKYPADYPKDGEEVTVTGVFSTYKEGDTMYCTLVNCDFTKSTLE